MSRDRSFKLISGSQTRTNIIPMIFFSSPVAVFGDAIYQDCNYDVHRLFTLPTHVLFMTEQ